LKPETLRRVRLLVHPDTVLRWHQRPDQEAAIFVRLVGWSAGSAR
jgi:hypothetical protein